MNNKQENLLSLIYHLGNINSDNDIQFQVYETAKEWKKGKRERSREERKEGRREGKKEKRKCRESRKGKELETTDITNWEDVEQ